MPATISVSGNYRVIKLIIDETSCTLDLYFKDRDSFISLSETIDEYDDLSQTDEVAPETFELNEDINELIMRFKGNIKDSLKFVNEYLVFSGETYQSALSELSRLTTIKIEEDCSVSSQQLEEVRKNPDGDKKEKDEYKETGNISTTILSSSLNNSSSLFHYNLKGSPESDSASKQLVGVKLPSYC